MSILFERYLVDGLIGLYRWHGAITDIDFVTMKNNIWNILEIKSKDPSRGGQFGIDTRRSKDLSVLQEKAKTPVWYVIQQISDQAERIVTDWRYLSLDDFKQNISTTLPGGLGYNPSVPDTVLVNQDKFHHIKLFETGMTVKL